MTFKIKHKRGTASAVASANPTPAAGELVFETDTRRFKLGDGSTAYTSLAYVAPNAGDITSGTLDAARLPLATTGAAGAVIVGTGLGVSSGTVSVTYGTSSTSACRGDDSRLSDTRTPTDGSVTTAKIANDAVTYAKIQNVSATDRLLGRSSAGAGDVEEITCTSFGRSLIDDADAAAARTTLSVQPTASPTFTGTAIVSGTFQVKANSGSLSHAFGYNENGGEISLYTTSEVQASLIDHVGGTGTRVLELVNGNSLYLGLGASNTTGNVYIQRAGYQTAITVSSTGTATFTGQVLVTAGSVSACSVAPSGDPNTGLYFPAANVAAVVTDGVERVRVDASGNVLIGQSTTGDPAGANTNGIALAPDYISVSRSSFVCLRLNIKAADGTIVDFFQDGALEGSISVSGNTVSYNAFCGSHWAQFFDQSRPSILRGTVLETIDEMCEWPDGKSDRLPRVKVSDTPASRRVYGVFMAYDEQYASTGDMYVTALGAYMVRVSGVVQSGDLLESAGDGTARTQADDLVRSTTIGKVSSTHRIAEYDDGSYLVPCVLMCG